MPGRAPSPGVPIIQNVGQPQARANVLRLANRESSSLPSLTSSLPSHNFPEPCPLSSRAVPRHGVQRVQQNLQGLPPGVAPQGGQRPAGMAAPAQQRPASGAPQGTAPRVLTPAAGQAARPTIAPQTQRPQTHEELEFHRQKWMVGASEYILNLAQPALKRHKARAADSRSPPSLCSSLPCRLMSYRRTSSAETVHAPGLTWAVKNNQSQRLRLPRSLPHNQTRSLSHCADCAQGQGSARARPRGRG